MQAAARAAAMRNHTRHAVESGIETIADAIAQEAAHRLLRLPVNPAQPRREHIADFIGDSAPMQDLFAQIRKVAPTLASVLLVGESGTGKEKAAKALHDLSPRGSEPLIAVNCGGMPETVVEAELFGFERGSFTGALKAHAGHFERAGRGTLFLDEVTEMPADMQVKLLRVLESRRFRRVGGEHELECHCRIIAATNRDPQKAVQEGRLRADLLYRLGGFPLTLPPLRDRTGDAVLLASHFLKELNEEHGTCKRLSATSLRVIQDYSWPGNVRELGNAVRRAFILADAALELEPGGLEYRPADDGPDHEVMRVPIGTRLADVERELVLATLASCDGNKTRAAAALGFSLKTLYNRLHEYGMM